MPVFHKLWGTACIQQWKAGTGIGASKRTKWTVWFAILFHWQFYLFYFVTFKRHSNREVNKEKNIKKNCKNISNCLGKSCSFKAAGPSNTLFARYFITASSTSFRGWKPLPCSEHRVQFACERSRGTCAYQGTKLYTPSHGYTENRLIGY